MDFIFAGAEDAPGAASAPGRKNSGKRKGPNLDDVHAVGSSKRVTGIIPPEHWGDRQYADLEAYCARKTSAERDAKGCYRWTGKGKVGENSAVASFCGMRYDAQMLVYLAHHREEEINPREKIIASCGDRKCLTPEHLSLARAGASALQVTRRTPYYSLQKWKSMDGKFTLRDHLIDIAAL